MQILKQHKVVVLISVFLVVVLAVSIVVYVETSSKPTATPSPTASPTLSPLPTQNTPTSTLTATPTPPATATPTPAPTLTEAPPASFPGEITQYQGQQLTPIGTYLAIVGSHPEVAIGGVQNIDMASYRLAITGLVNTSERYSFDEVVNNFNSTLQMATLPCVEGWSVNMLWQGVLLTDLLQPAGISPDANTLIFYASDGYSTSLPLYYVKQNNIMIAYKMNNVTLMPQTGWPFFLVAKSQYGYKWIEWITEINVSNDASYRGYWESRGYPNLVSNLPDTQQPPNNTLLILSIVAVSILGMAAAAAVLLRQIKRGRVGFNRNNSRSLPLNVQLCTGKP